MRVYQWISNSIVVWLALLIIYQVRADCPRDVDPCSSSVYTPLDTPTRSILYNVTDSSNENDYALPERWYRSVSGAGGDMPTEVVYTGQCNAYAPIYLTDRLSSQADGIVDLSACASFLDDTCTRSYTIPVKNCGSYNVYCLSPVIDAFDRYCMGSELECPDGYTSYNGFTPGCEEIVGTIGECPMETDPCLSSVYVELDAPTRSTLFNVTTSNENDYALSQEWYRSVSGAGGDMSTDAVYTGQCNAYAPIYLTDRLPLESEGIVTAKGCASFLDDTCVRQYYIPIKNCGDYNVYCLPATADAFDRYCFGSELECPDGYTSYNGFTPGCEEIDGTIGECSTDNNPCLSSVYVELDAPTRSTLFNVTASNENDYALSQEWYHSVSGAGGDMSTEVVYTGQCNAYAPIYLTDRLPLESEGIVTAKGCASFLDDTCVRQYYIPIKNCGDYNVYCLPPTADAFDRYCFGSELECSEGYTSDNGFTPGCVPIEETTMVTTVETEGPSMPTPISTSSSSVTNSHLYRFSEETTRRTVGETQGPSTPNPPQTISVSVTDISEGPNETDSDEKSAEVFSEEFLITIIVAATVILVLIAVTIIAVACVFKQKRASSANAVKETYARPQSPPPAYTEIEPPPSMHHPNSPRRTRAPSGRNHVIRGSFGNNRVSSAVSHATAPTYDRSMTPVF